ncbi:MAG: hypothetical protein LBP19_05320 [Treponema sp.]|jgi:hypothetical protein|nr:hypothetical protein [Treponema sp.]
MPVLPYPFEYDGETIREFDVKEATTSAIAASQKNSLPYAAMKSFLTGVLCSLNGNEEQTFIRNALLSIPFESAFTALVYGMAKTKEDDSIHGAYACPHCGEIRRAESDDETEHVLQFEITPAPLTFDFNLGGVPIVNKVNGAVIESVGAISMTAPTLDALIRGERRFPDNPILTQSFAYAQSIVSVNNTPVDKSWKDKYGEVLFNKLSIKKTNELSKELAAYSPFNNIERVCLKCFHRWKTRLDFTNFFDFGAV